jgi:hypothetical protein
LQWNMLVYFVVNWNILRPIGIFYGHCGYVVIIWYIFHRFCVLCQDKSGNPVDDGLLNEVSVRCELTTREPR